MEVADDEGRNPVRGEPFSEPRRSDSAFLAADREHGFLIPSPGGGVERPHETSVGDRCSHRGVSPLTPAPHEGRGRDRSRCRDRRQDESPRCAPPRVVGERLSVRRSHRGHQPHRPHTTRIDAAGLRPSSSEIEHTVLVGAECRPREEHPALRIGRAQLEPDALQPPEPFEPNAHRLVLDRHRRRHLESQYGVRGATAARRHNGEQKAGEQSRARPAILARRRAPTRAGYCRL